MRDGVSDEARAEFGDIVDKYGGRFVEPVVHKAWGLK